MLFIPAVFICIKVCSWL